MQKKLKALTIITAVVSVVLLNSCKKNTADISSNGAVTIQGFSPSQGAMTTEILITGTGFTSDTSKLSVSINGTRLPVVGANGTQIIAVIPPRLRSGSLVVTVNGNAVTSDSTFTYIPSYTVSTLAGNGVEGFANGQGSAAQFFFTDSTNPWVRPMGIVVDNNTMNVYVADANNCCIRKIDSAGNVTTLAGSPGVYGSSDGQGSSASFALLYGLAIDQQGNVYSADPGAWRIAKTTPDGTTTTITWTPADPWGIAIDTVRNVIYYTSTGNNRIYSMPLTGNNAFQSTLISSDLSFPAGITVDNDGNLFVAVNGSNEIVKLQYGTWAESVVAGTGAAGYVNGAPDAAQFNNPWGLVIDQYGNLYTGGNGAIIPKTNSSNNGQDNSVRMIAAGTGAVSAIAGSTTPGFTNGLGSMATFFNPEGVAVDKNGNIYVLDKLNDAVRKITIE